MIKNIQYLNILLGLSLYNFISGSEQTTIQHSRPQTNFPISSREINFCIQIASYKSILHVLAYKAQNRRNNSHNR
jgi:hypothetical protein